MINSINNIYLNNSALKVNRIGQNSSFTQQPCSVPFNAAPKFVTHPSTIALNPIRTRLEMPEEKKQYNEIVSKIPSDTRKKLDSLLKTGKLLNNQSNDKSTTLENLYKILTTNRAEEIDRISILNDTITAIDNPYSITQEFGDIPAEYMDEAIDRLTGNDRNVVNRKMAQLQLENTRSGCCVAASIEFNLANKKPAEFARMANELSSDKKSAKKVIELNNLSDQTLDAVWLLNAFETKKVLNNYESSVLTFEPDKDAYFRAKIQTTNRDKHERSALDVLMQSAFMNIGSQQTYNSLTDMREGKFSDEKRGLIDFEKTYTESVVGNKNTTSIIYQTVDENQRLIGYETDFATTKRQILDALKMGENVIIGYTITDDYGQIINGHEITIVDTKTAANGELIFVCNDTDDDLDHPIEYTESYLLPKIHHAGLPQAVVENDVNYVDNWVIGVDNFKSMIQQQYRQSA